MNIIPLLTAARKASAALQLADDSRRRALTMAIADAVAHHADAILQANAADTARMDANNPMADRLRLTPERLTAIADATRLVGALPDPCGVQLSSHRHAGGFVIRKITVPLGVVGAIYESRPNVTVDIAALCLRSGNAVVLKGGSDAAESNKVLVDIMQKVLTAQGLPAEAITLLPNDREATAALMQADRWIDVIVPRGSQQLIDFVRSNATVPVIETGAGVCHTYVHADADLDMATRIIVNAKTQRPSVCNALDTLVADESIAAALLEKLAGELRAWPVGLYADEKAYPILSGLKYPLLKPAQPSDFGHEFLSLNCSIKIVQNEGEALAHIAAYSSRHSECIVTENEAVAQQFLQSVDAAAVYHNVSTRFTDGGEFGLGAELGISTQKLHARGPFALEKLVCEKWIVAGNGQTR